MTLTILARAWESRSAPREVLAYIVPAVLGLLAVQTWFESGTAIATGDLAPPVAPGGGYTSHWSHLNAGEGAPGFAIVSLPYAGWLDVWTSLGGGEEFGQRLWLSVLFAGSAAAVVFLTFGFTTSAIAAGTAGLLASFSAYRLVTGADPVPMAAIIVAALLAGIIVRVALRPDRKQSVVGFALASVGLGYVMANPPQVALVVLWVGACLAVVLTARPAAANRIVAFLAAAVPLSLLVNAWWIVPASLTLTGPAFGERFGAAGVDEWAWTHERASYVNALTLNTSWAWSYSEYYPYAEHLDDLPVGFLKFSLPALALIGVLIVRRKITVGLAVVALLAAWFATGLHGPAPGINRWFYDHVPGFWLFREPGKFLLLVLLPFAVLGGLAVARLVHRRSPWTAALALGLAAGAIFYGRPLFTGDVVPQERPLLPSAHVQVPDGWWNVAAALHAERDTGKVLFLPRSDYYQMPTTWGYYGASFSRWLIRRPVLESVPGGGYFHTEPRVAELEESVEADLLNGRAADVRSKLRALGARYILLRRDVDADFPDRRIAAPRALAAGLRRSPGIERVRSFGVAELYRVAGPFGEDVFAARPILYAGSTQALAPALSAVRGRPGFVTDGDDQHAVVQAGMQPVRIIRFEEEMVRRLSVRRQGELLRVRLTDPFRVAVEGRTLPSASSGRIATVVPTGPVVITAGNAVHSFRRAPASWTNLGLVALRKGQSLNVWRLVEARHFPPVAAGRVGDCNAVDGRSKADVGIRSALVDSGDRPTLRLSARAHSACVTFPLAQGPIRNLYTVRFRYRRLQGSPARACLWQSRLDRCAALPALRPGRGWHSVAATIQPDPRITALSLFLYADGRGGLRPTVTEYQAIRLERYRPAAALPYAPTPIRAQPEALFPATSFAVERGELPGEVDLRRAGPVGDCHRYDHRTPKQVGLAARVIGRGSSPVLQLRARDHSACVEFPIKSFEPGTRVYRIHFEYRKRMGSSPRLCLWQMGPDRCAPTPGLKSDSKWRVLDQTVRLDPNVTALQLFLYADGVGGPLTITEYRNARVGPVGSAAILGLPPQWPLPRIVVRRDASWKFHVRVIDARAPFLLATSEAYAPGWKAEADGRDASELRHIRVNGYANGWLVPWDGTYELTLEYGPERYAIAARWLGLLAVLAVLLWLAVQGVQRFLVRRADRLRWSSRNAFRLPRFGKDASKRAVQRGSGG